MQNTLTDKYDRSKSQMQTSIKTLKLQKQQAESEVASLTGDNNALKGQQSSAKIKISHLEETVNNLTNREQRSTNEIESMKETLRKSQEDHSFHRDDAQQLRAYISQVGKQQSPIRDDTIYIRGFRELKTDVESWIARNAKASAAQIFSINQEAHILGTLAESGIHGQKASVYLRTDNRVQRWYRNPSYRIVSSKECWDDIVVHVEVRVDASAGDCCVGLTMVAVVVVGDLVTISKVGMAWRSKACHVGLIDAGENSTASG